MASSTVKTAKAFGVPIVHSTVCELRRDWAREETVADVIEIVLTERLLKA